MKNLILIIMITLGLYGFLVLFSESTSNYQCNGTIAGQALGSNTRIFFELNEYRPWVGLWSDSDGSMMLESATQYLRYHSKIKDIGTQLQILNEDSSIVGAFSKLSGKVSIQTIDGFFDGTCALQSR